MHRACRWRVFFGCCTCCRPECTRSTACTGLQHLQAPREADESRKQWLCRQLQRCPGLYRKCQQQRQQQRDRRGRSWETCGARGSLLRCWDQGWDSNTGLGSRLSNRIMQPSITSVKGSTGWSLGAVRQVSTNKMSIEAAADTKLSPPSSPSDWRAPASNAL